MILTKKGVLIQIIHVLVYDTLIAAVYAMNDESDIDGILNFNAAIVGNKPVFKFTCESFQRPIGDAISFQVNLSTVDVIRHSNNTCYDRYQECRTDTCLCYYDGVKFKMEYWYEVLDFSESFKFGVELILKDTHANIVVVTLSRFYNGKDFEKLEIVKETNQYKFMDNTEKFVNDSEMGASKEWILKVLSASVGLILMVIFSVLVIQQYYRMARGVVQRCLLFKFSYLPDESKELKPYISNTTTTDRYIPNGAAYEKSDSETDLMVADNELAEAERSCPIKNFASVPDIIEGLERNEECFLHLLVHENRTSVIDFLDCDVKPAKDEPFVFSQENKSKSFDRKMQSSDKKMQYSYNEIDIDQSIDAAKNSPFVISHANKSCGKTMQCSKTKKETNQCIDVRGTDSEGQIYISSTIKSTSVLCRHHKDETTHSSVPVQENEDVCRSSQLIDEDYETDEVSSAFDETESSHYCEFSAENNNTQGDIWELRAGQLIGKDYETAEVSSEFEETGSGHLFEFSAKNNNAEGDIWEFGAESGQLFECTAKNNNTDGDIWEFGAEFGLLPDHYPECNDTEGDIWKLGDIIPYEDIESDEDSSDFEDTDIELSTETLSTCVMDSPSSKDDESIGMHLCSSCMSTSEKIFPNESPHEDTDSVIDISFFNDEPTKDQSDIVVQPYKSLSKKLQYSYNTEEDQSTDARRAHSNWQINIGKSPVLREDKLVELIIMMMNYKIKSIKAQTYGLVPFEDTESEDDCYYFLDIETEYTPSITKNKEKAPLVIRETETWKSRSIKALENLRVCGSYSKDCRSTITCKNADERQLVSKTSLKTVTGVPNINFFDNANSLLRSMQARDITVLYIPFKDFDRNIELLIHSTICRSFRFHICSCVNRQDPKLGDDDHRHFRLGLKHRKSKLCSNMHMDDPHIDDFDTV